jgi:hypothetical protein
MLIMKELIGQNGRYEIFDAYCHGSRNVVLTIENLQTGINK